LKLKGGIYALDATVVDLCLNVFWWASFRITKGAIKINTLLDLKTSIPEYIFITEGSVHEVNILDYICVPRGSYLVMDKAYVDFARLWKLSKDNITFVIRTKDNMKYKVTNRKIVDKRSGVICDQTIELKGIKTSQKYPDKLRRIRYFDKETGNVLIFITNNFKISSLTVASFIPLSLGNRNIFQMD
jgi:hypothetical protein